MFTAFIAGTPKPQGSKNAYQRGGRIVLVESNKQLPEWRNNAINVFKANAPVEPLAGALVVSVFFYLPKPPSVKREYPHVKPDLDKLTRAIGDALTKARVIGDDGQITDFHLFKRYSDTPGALVLVDYLT